MNAIESRAMKAGEAAKYLNMSPGMLRGMSDRGEIPCKRLGKYRYFLREDLLKWQSSLPDWSATNGQSA